ncbi:UPF0158 family protein [Pseudomonas mangiferae]|uniref:Uncharacterized protein n=1 Tax=Pseudomonas mangiferae TaxID=2593654 RepID=A0A553GYX3_9PSED|nr:UPF0158 family protein [Pseudomonas mangiferae]TRX74680.1 hypothetical protein FM069_11785 [Pseudomonas mangiferae]
MRTLTIDMDRLERLLDEPGQGEHYLDLDEGRLLALERDSRADDDTRRLVEDDPERYRRLEPLDSEQRLALREAFLFELDDPHAHPLLTAALGGRRPLRTFEYELERFPRAREAWQAYQRAQLREYALAWLETQGIEPATAARHPADDEDMPEGIRRRLLGRAG